MSFPQAAIVGLGFMGPTHTQMLRRLGVPVAGVLGIDQAEGERAAKELNLPRVYRDYDEILQDATVKVVHLCTPNHLHYPMAKAALQAGKHVICEKPLALNSVQSGELVELARRKGLIGVVNYNLRFYPVIQEARARIQAGEAGEVRLVMGAYLQDWLALPTDWNWRLDPELGGELRAVADIGTHWLDMIAFITGLQVKALLADLATFIPTRYKPIKEVSTFTGKLEKAVEAQPVKIKTEDIAVLLLQFENGARGALTLSQISPGRKNYFWWEVSGAKASLRWDQENPNLLWLGYRDRLNQILVKDPSLMQAQARPFAAFPGGHAEGYPDTFYQLFRLVYTALRDGKEVDATLVPTFDAGHRELLLCEAIQRSARERRWVEVP